MGHYHNIDYYLFFNVILAGPNKNKVHKQNCSSCLEMRRSKHHELVSFISIPIGPFSKAIQWLDGNRKEF